MHDNTHDQMFAQCARLMAERNQLMVERNHLVRAARALSRLDNPALLSVTPQAMQEVCKARGWTWVANHPVPGDPKTVGMEVWDNERAMSGYIVPCVMIPMQPTYGDYTRRVAEWATDLATRHGDVPPMEILAEALSLVNP